MPRIQHFTHPHVAIALLEPTFLVGFEALEYEGFTGQVTIVRPVDEAPFYLARNHLPLPLPLPAAPIDRPLLPWRVTRGSSYTENGYCHQWFGRPNELAARCRLVRLDREDRVPSVVYRWTDRSRGIGGYVTAERPIGDDVHAPECPCPLHRDAARGPDEPSDMACALTAGVSGAERDAPAAVSGTVEELSRWILSEDRLAAMEARFERFERRSDELDGDVLFMRRHVDDKASDLREGLGAVIDENHKTIGLRVGSLEVSRDAFDTRLTSVESRLREAEQTAAWYREFIEELVLITARMRK